MRTDVIRAQRKNMDRILEYQCNAEAEEVLYPLGHGLDQSAERAIQGTRFAPALDASGHPVDWEGVVRVNFQLAD